MLKVLYFSGQILGAVLRFLFGIRHSEVYGNARFMSRLEMAMTFNRRNSGLQLSKNHRMTFEDSFKNSCIFAPTGMGKTSRFVIPNILSAGEASIVVTDPSGEVFRKTSGHMCDRGYDIAVFQPTDPARSSSFNPCLWAKTSADLDDLAKSLSTQLGNDTSIWRTSAEHLLFLGLSALANIPDPALNHLSNLRRILNRFEGQQSVQLDRFMARHLGGDHLFDEYQAFQAKDSKFKGGVLASALACLNQWKNESVCQITSNDTLHLDRLRTRPTVLYIIIPEDKIPNYATITNLLYTAAFEQCLAADGLPVLFFLDEFGNLGEINNFATIATTLRKRRCSLNLILQDISQVEKIYGKTGAQTILRGGTQNKLFFGGLDVAIAEEIESRMGTRTVYGTAYGGVHEKATPLKAPLMAASEICQLQDQEVLLLSGNRRPARFRLQPFYQNRRFASYTRKPPYWPTFHQDATKVSYLDFNWYGPEP